METVKVEPERYLAPETGNLREKAAVETLVEQLPRTGRLQFSVHVSADLNFSATAARRRAGRFVADEISYLMRGGEPNLVIADRIYWRVPILLTFPGRGSAGSVGVIDVDVETGQLRVTPELIVEIQQRATDLASHQTSG